MVFCLLSLNSWTKKLLNIFYCFCATACKGLDGAPSKLVNDKEPITSPLYPEPYPPNTNCTWLVSAPNNTAVGFKVTDFDLATEDYVEVRDGNNETDVPLHFYNRTKPRLDHWWTSSGQFLWIRFKSSNAYKGLGGFKMQIQFLKVPEGK